MDNQLINYLYEKCQMMVKKFCFDEQKHFDHQDLSQEIFIKMIESFDKYQPEKSQLTTYAGKVIYNHLNYLLCRNPFYSKYTQSLDVSVDNGEDTSQTLVEFIEDNCDMFNEIDFRMDLERYLNSISGVKKTILERIQEGFNVKEIAEQLNYTVQYVYQQINKMKLELQLL